MKNSKGSKSHNHRFPVYDLQATTLPTLYQREQLLKKDNKKKAIQIKKKKSQENLITHFEVSLKKKKYSECCKVKQMEFYGKRERSNEEVISIVRCSNYFPFVAGLLLQNLT